MLKLTHVLLLASLFIFTDPAIVRCIEKEKAAPEAASKKGDSTAQEADADGCRGFIVFTHNGLSY